MKIGDLEVTVVQKIGPGVVYMEATCGKSKCKGNMTLHPQHDRTAEQLAKDIGDYSTRLATECAGHERSRILLEEHFKAKPNS